MKRLRNAIRVNNITRETVKKTISGLNNLSQVALVLMMFLTAADVVLRYIFNSPIIFAQEITEFLLVIVIAMGLSFCAIDNQHVRVDMLVDKLPKRFQNIIDSFTGILTFVFLILIVWRSFVHMHDLVGKRFTSLVLNIPLYPFVGLIGLGFLLFIIVITIELKDSFKGVWKK